MRITLQIASGEMYTPATHHRTVMHRDFVYQMSMFASCVKCDIRMRYA